MLSALLLCAGLAGPLPQAPARLASPTQLASIDERLVALLPRAAPEERARAFAEVRDAGDARYLAPLVDLLRFADTREEWFQILDSGSVLLEEDLRALESPWRNLTLRLAAREAIAYPRGYAAWKGELLAQRVDPRFREFLYDEVPTTVRLDEVVWGGVAVDGIPALEDPATLLASEASYLDPDEPVFGVSLNGEHRAYPLRILDWHEMANDTLGGVPIALAYCTLCGAGVVYGREFGGTTTTFGSSGLLMRSNKLMFDRATKSLWNQLTGAPVIGPLVGEELQLEVLPSVVTTWSRWSAQHPDTSVLSLDTGHDRDYRPGAAYGDYFGSSRTMFPTLGESGELSDKEQLFAVRVDGRAKAFPASLVRERGVWNDRVGDTNVVVLGPPPARDRPLPPRWVEALGSGSEALEASELTASRALRILDADPALLDELDRTLGLALRPETRIAILERFGPEGPTPRIAPDLRDELASFGLAAEARAYERGNTRFEPAATPGELLDAEGRPWEITEDALLGPGDQRLARLPGHLVFAFGWQSFFPDGELAD